jgi:hypothetical protein
VRSEIIAGPGGNGEGRRPLFLAVLRGHAWGSLGEGLEPQLLSLSVHMGLCYTNTTPIPKPSSGETGRGI